MKKTLYKICGLSVESHSSSGAINILNNVDLTINKGEILGLVGPTGSGKSMLAWSLVDLLPMGCKITSGNITRDGKTEADLSSLRGKHTAMIFQDPMQSLNPIQTIGKQFTIIAKRKSGDTHEDAKSNIKKWLKRVRLDSVHDILDRFPHQLSGGQMQRVMIAFAISIVPEFIIADEITTGLDANTKIEIMDLLFEIQSELDIGILLISHDLGSVRRYCKRVAVMRSGSIVTEGSTNNVFSEKNGYTSSIIKAYDKTNSRLNTPRGKNKNELILSINNFKKSYFNNGLINRAINNVSVDLYQSTTLGLVGESGSGKTTLARMILNILDRDSGTLEIKTDKDSPKNLYQLTNKIGAVFQDNMASFNPRMTIFEILLEPLWLVGIRDLESTERKINQIMADIDLDLDLLSRYPHSLSGGQRQRVSIARAMILNPKILILDEPTSALDINIQHKILALLKSLQKHKKLSYLFISHDLAVISQMADMIAVLYKGEIIEVGNVAEVLNNPQQDYTKNLIASSMWKQNIK